MYKYQIKKMEKEVIAKQLLLHKIFPNMEPVVEEIIKGILDVYFLNIQRATTINEEKMNSPPQNGQRPITWDSQKGGGEEIK